MTDAAVPVEIDASLDASVCDCPGSELLSRDHLHVQWGETNVSGDGVGDSCTNPEAKLIGGSCGFVDTTSSFRDIITSGFFTTSAEDFWLCEVFSGVTFLLIGTICVDDLPRDIPAECQCPDIETPRERFLFVEQIISISPDSVGEVSSTCPTGSSLVGGSCEGSESSFGHLALISSGVHPDAPQSWRCSWHNLDTQSQSGIGGTATAVCLGHPGPDAVTGESVAPETIEYVFAEDTVPAEQAHIVEATCQPGDVLVSGGCYQMPGADGGPARQLRLKRFGVINPADNRPNTWQCAWKNNDATAEITVTAMASCVKP